jgi:hypothetical protein
MEHNKWGSLLTLFLLVINKNDGDLRKICSFFTKLMGCRRLFEDTFSLPSACLCYYQVSLFIFVQS